MTERQGHLPEEGLQEHLLQSHGGNAHILVGCQCGPNLNRVPLSFDIPPHAVDTLYDEEKHHGNEEGAVEASHLEGRLPGY